MVETELLREVKQLNRNFDWLKKNRNTLTELDNLPEWVDAKKAMSYMDKGKTWLKSKMIQPEDIKQPMNVNWFLVFGIDWKREGVRIIFRRESLQKLKEELVNMGITYQKTLQN